MTDSKKNTYDRGVAVGKRLGHVAGVSEGLHTALLTVNRGGVHPTGLPLTPTEIIRGVIAEITSRSPVESNEEEVSIHVVEPLACDMCGEIETDERLGSEVVVCRACTWPDEYHIAQLHYAIDRAIEENDVTRLKALRANVPNTSWKGDPKT